MQTHASPSETPILAWSAPLHAHQTRGKLWYCVAGAFVLFCIGYSLWTRAWSFTAVIIILGFLYYREHETAPGAKRISIWKRGFAIENDVTEWKDCNGYWILRFPTYAELHIEKRNGRLVKMQTGDTDPYLLHDVLQPLIPERKDGKERILDTFIRICKL